MSERKNDDIFSNIFAKNNFNEETILNKMDELENKNEDFFYTHIFQVLAEVDFKPDIAKKEWKNIFKHKHLISNVLGRQVDFRVAMLDYFINTNKIIKNPKIMEFKLFTEFAKLMMVDELTQVYNRHYFNTALNREFNQAKRYGRELSIILLDVDNLKEINDRFGHPKGDMALRKLGKILKNNIRSEDTACRIGGDEFVIILPDTDPNGAAFISMRIHNNFSREKINNKYLSISSGIATYPHDTTKLGDLIKVADKLLYRAKDAGRKN